MSQKQNARRGQTGGAGMNNRKLDCPHCTTLPRKEQVFDIHLSLHLDALVAEEDALLERIEAGPVRREVYQELARLRGERAWVENLTFGGSN